MLKCSAAWQNTDKCLRRVKIGLVNRSSSFLSNNSKALFVRKTMQSTTSLLQCLLSRLQSHNYEERYRTVEGELRKLVAMRGELC